MIRLALRLAAAGGRSSLVPIGLTALAVAFGTAILLFALSFEPALATRYDHAAWRDTYGTGDLATATSGLLLSRTDDHWQGRQIVRMDVAALSPDAPVPPGLAAVPAAGETFLSPALAALVAQQPAAQLGDRFGPVSGTIAEDGLKAPDELAAIVGRDPTALRADGARVVDALDGTGWLPLPSSPLIQLLVVVAVIGALAPVAVFVGTATRLSAARREQRLAALRLVGATPRQVAGFATVEALAATVPGALGGLVLFVLLRPAVAMIPMDQATWFPAAIVPPVGQAVALLLVVQLVGVLAAVVALRRVTVSPLGVQRRERRRPLRRTRLLPLAASMVAFALVLARVSSQGLTDDWLLWLFGATFFGIILGVAIAGPWLTAGVGRMVAAIARGPVGLLAGRRLADDPRSAFGAIGGVVMAVFIGSAYLSIASFASATTPVDERLDVRPDVLTVSIPGDGSAADRAATELAAVPGVLAVAPVREVVVDPAGAGQLGVIADCRQLVLVLSAPDLACGPGLLHLGPGGTAVTDASLLTSSFLGGYLPPSRPGGEGTIHVDPAAIDRYAPATMAPEARLVLPALIIDPRAVSDPEAFAVSRIAVLTDGTPAAVERARTVAQVVMPTSVVRTVGEAAADGAAIVTELGRIVTLGVLGAMLLAGASLAIAVISGLVERRRPFALLRLSGMPLGRLKAVLLVEAAAPLIAVAALSAVLGVAVAQLVLRSLPTRGAPAPDVGIVGLLAVAVVGALAVVAFAMPLVDRLTGTQTTRFE